MEQRNDPIEEAGRRRETTGAGTGGIGGGQFPGAGIDTSLGDASTGGEAAREALGEEAVEAPAGFVPDDAVTGQGGAPEAR